MEYESAKTCIECGAPIGDGQLFCSKCGAPQSVPQKNVCGKCGAELQEKQAFCHKCGQERGLTADAECKEEIERQAEGDRIRRERLAEISHRAEEERKKRNKKIANVSSVMVCFTVVIAVIIVVVALLTIKPFASVESFCAQGDYIKAYERASGEEKDSVLAENVIAYNFGELSYIFLEYMNNTGMQNDFNYSISEGYHTGIVLDDGSLGQAAGGKVSLESSPGVIEEFYVLWVGNSVTDEWRTTIVDPNDDGVDQGDLDLLLGLIRKGVHLDESQIENIIAQRDKGTLHDVKLIDWEGIDTSRFLTEG